MFPVIAAIDTVIYFDVVNVMFKCYIICDNIRIMNYFTIKVIGWGFRQNIQLFN